MKKSELKRVVSMEIQRKEKIKAFSFPGQEALVQSLILEGVALENAMKRLIVDAKENFREAEEDPTKRELLDKLQAAAPKHIESKTGEPKNTSSLRDQISREKDEQKRIQIRREINKLNKKEV